MKRPDWILEIKEDDLPDEFQGLAGIIGLANVIETIFYFEGSEKYFPKVDSTFKQVRDRIIRQRWRKHNIHELAKEFNLSHNQIRDIVKDHEDQIDLFKEEDEPDS